MPDSFHKEMCEHYDAPAQAVMLALLSHSDDNYKPVWPSIPTLCKMTGNRSENTVRARLRFMEMRQDLGISKTYHKTKRGQVCNHTYFFKFARYIELDIENGKPGCGANVPRLAKLAAERAAKKILEKEVHRIDNRIDKLEFDFAALPQNLRVYGEYLVHVGREGRADLFRAKTPLSQSYVEEEFRKGGKIIRIIGAA